MAHLVALANQAHAGTPLANGQDGGHDYVTHMQAWSAVCRACLLKKTRCPSTLSMLERPHACVLTPDRRSHHKGVFYAAMHHTDLKEMVRK